MSFDYRSDYDQLLGGTSTQDPLLREFDSQRYRDQLYLVAGQAYDRGLANYMQREQIKYGNAVLDTDRPLTGKFTDYLTTWQEGKSE